MKAPYLRFAESPETAEFGPSLNQYHEPHNTYLIVILYSHA